MHYELVVVVDPTLDAKQAQDKLTALLEKEGFVVSASESWGKKPLSYRLNKQKEGLYFVYQLTGGSVLPKQLHKRFKLENSVLRTILVRYTDTSAKKTVTN